MYINRRETLRLFGERMQQGILQYERSFQAYPNALRRKTIRLSSGKLSEKVYGPQLFAKTCKKS